MLDEAGLAVGALDERVAHHRHGVGDGPHDGVADEVGEADLAEPAALAVAVDHLAVDLEQLGRDVAEAGRRRHGEAARHVGGDGGAGAADRGALLLGRLARLRRRDGRRGAPAAVAGAAGVGAVAAAGAGRARGGAVGAVAVRRARCRSATGSSSTSAGAGAEAWRLQGGVGRLVVGEELLPRLTDRLRVVPELLVHLLDQPGVGPEVGIRRRRRSRVQGTGRRRPGSGTPAMAVRPSRSGPSGGSLQSRPGARSRHRTTTWGVRIEQPVDRQDPQRRRRSATAGAARRRSPRRSSLRAGVLARAGRVEDGTTVCDTEPEEVKRTMSLSLAAGAVRVEGVRRRDVQDQPHRHARLRRLRR